MRILHFGTFDHDVGRNAIVAAALREAGVEIVECHEPLWRDTDDKLRAVRGARGSGLGLLQLAMTAARLMAAQWRLARRAGRHESIDVVLVGSTGHLDLPLARFVADNLGAVLVFDPLVSIGETVRDRALLPAGGFQLSILRRVERWLFSLADHVLVDTAVHAAALEREVGLDLDRVSIVPAGAPAVVAEVVGDYEAHTSADPTAGRREPIRIVYAGQYIPLHGIETVLRAAGRLRDRDDLRFVLVGIGQTLDAARALAAELVLPNVEMIETWMPLERLAREHLAPADICLGIFGDQPKAQRVVPFKVFAGLAAGRTVVTGDTPAVRELLTVGRESAGRTSTLVDRSPEAVLVPIGDPAALASTLASLADDPARRMKLAMVGRAAWAERFAPAALGVGLVDALERAIQEAEPPRLEGPRHRWRTKRLASELLAAVPPGVLLDAGCGNGSMAIQLADQERSVLAFDSDRQRIATARHRALQTGAGDRVHHFVADMTAIPLRAGEITGVAAGEVLEHVTDDRSAVAEIARVLAPGGVLAATVPAGPERFSPLDQSVGHVRRYDRSTLEEVVRSAGLDIDRLSGWGVPFGRLYDVIIQRPVLGASHRISIAGRIFEHLGEMSLIDTLLSTVFSGDQRAERWVTPLEQIGAPREWLDSMRSSA